MIVLDTHTLLWWVNRDSDRLSNTAAKTISDQLKDGRICVSSITVWEIAHLVAHGRFTLGMALADWVAVAEDIPEVEFVPVDNIIAADSVTLPEPFHRDPADRFIVATARKLSAPLVTIDRKIRAYPHVQTIW